MGLGLGLGLGLVGDDVTHPAGDGEALGVVRDAVVVVEALAQHAWGGVGVGFRFACGLGFGLWLGLGFGLGLGCFIGARRPGLSVEPG